MQHQIGIMQGRLTPSKGRGIQFFPFDNWENEFYIAQELGLNEIEFIFDFEHYTQNPLWTRQGIDKIWKLKEKTNIQVNTVCFDYFMRRPFYKAELKKQILMKDENTQIIKKILLAMKELNITLIEIPLVDNSSLKNEKEKSIFQKWLLEIIAQTDESIKFALETDLPPESFLDYLKEFNSLRVGANYDSGNSSGLGYNLYEEVLILKNYIFNIHIKDRIYHGTTVQLGTGNADFEKLFKGLSEIKYKYNFILQAARGIDGEEVKNIFFQKEFLGNIIKRYNV